MIVEQRCIAPPSHCDRAVRHRALDSPRSTDGALSLRIIASSGALCLELTAIEGRSIARPTLQSSNGASRLRPCNRQMEHRASDLAIDKWSIAPPTLKSNNGASRLRPCNRAIEHRVFDFSERRHGASRLRVIAIEQCSASSNDCSVASQSHVTVCTCNA